MDKLEERLDNVKEMLQSSDFLEGKGLSNEVNIRIFCYEPEKEMAIRHFVRQLEIDQTLACPVSVCDLYEVLLAICEEMGIEEAIPEMEESDGSEFLLEQLHSAISNSDFADKLRERAGKGCRVLVLTGVGSVFPFMRIHNLLEALQPYFSDIPILVLYPGTFDRYQVKLFNRLSPNDYYRAFNVV